MHKKAQDKVSTICIPGGKTQITEINTITPAIKHLTNNQRNINSQSRFELKQKQSYIWRKHIQ